MRINGMVAAEGLAAVQMDEFRDESVGQSDLAGNDREGIFAGERLAVTTPPLVCRVVGRQRRRQRTAATEFTRINSVGPGETASPDAGGCHPWSRNVDTMAAREATRWSSELTGSAIESMGTPRTTPPCPLRVEFVRINSVEPGETASLDANGCHLRSPNVDRMAARKATRRSSGSTGSAIEPTGIRRPAPPCLLRAEFVRINSATDWQGATVVTRAVA